MSEHEPGPWRWELAPKTKMVMLVGGARRFDVSVMDFCRWGMGSATPRFRDPNDLGLLTAAETFSIPCPGREHHKWFRLIDHPDANLMADAPAMLLALRMLELGVATMESRPFGKPVKVFVFDGVVHSCPSSGEWTKLLDRIGWNRARIAVASALPKIIGPKEDD